MGDEDNCEGPFVDPDSQDLLGRIPVKCPRGSPVVAGKENGGTGKDD
jgi:hypothetical protein